MTSQSYFHRNYQFTDGDLVVRAEDSAGHLIRFKIHREKVASLSPELGRKFGLEKIIGEGKAILGSYCYNQEDDANLREISLEQVYAIWKAAAEYRLHSLVMAEVDLALYRSQAKSQWTGDISMAIYLTARSTGRDQLKRMAWSVIERKVAVEGVNILAFESVQLAELTKAEFELLAKARTPKEPKDGTNEPAKKRRRSEDPDQKTCA